MIQQTGRGFGSLILSVAAAVMTVSLSAAAFTCSESAKAKARDFIDNEKQFQLGFLPTEQSNPITATLEEDFKRSTVAGVQCLQRADRQVPITLRHVFAGERYAKMVDSMVATLKAPKGRIIFSGCGATGRLSILLESMWRAFFYRRAAELSAAEWTLAERSASIMTGGDFALIKSVESFEDSLRGGERQAEALQVGEGDTLTKSFGEVRLFTVCPTRDSPLEVWKHLAVKLTFNNLSTGTMVKMGRVSGNWMSWVSISNKKLIDRGIRLIAELGRVDYEEAAQRLFAAEEWVNSQDWTGKETPCAVQVALKELRSGR